MQLSEIHSHGGSYLPAVPLRPGESSAGRNAADQRPSRSLQLSSSERRNLIQRYRQTELVAVNLSSTSDYAVYAVAPTTPAEQSPMSRGIATYVAVANLLSPRRVLLDGFA
jgi:hypothetical protein